ncbi:MAG TPA: hypothetical protein VGW32_03050 [Pyrinomonadaceae bacterium]|nr:hypothetical protein [Pyrinomonadaceae bacterium]
MQLFDPNNPNEKKKMIVAAVLAVGALLVLGYLFLGGGSTKPTTRATASPTPTPQRGPNKPPPEDEDISVYQEIVYNGTVVGAPEADRNIFAYYVPPPPPVKPTPPPTPEPTPPLNVSTVSPASVFARTGDFSLQVMGDKFAPGVRIVIDGRAMPTRIISTQQVATTVTADMIANPGNRRIEVRTADGSLYSNVVNLNVTAPPDPRNSFSYIGLIGKPRGNDIAVLQDKNNKELVNAQRGDLVGGRFRLTSISDKELKLVDVNLKIPHTIAFTPDTSTGGRPPVRRPVVDDDPE